MLHLLLALAVAEAAAGLLQVMLLEMMRVLRAAAVAAPPGEDPAQWGWAAAVGCTSC